MYKEIIEYLKPAPGMTVVDATAGTGGHSIGIIQAILPGGRLVAIDRDQESLSVARQRLAQYAENCDFVYGNFSEIDLVLQSKGIDSVDGIVYDLGISTYQLENPQRGFSFQKEGPLDMRLDRNSYISAYDLLNSLNEREISNLLWVFGEERWHNRIAHQLVQEREKQPISTTAQLSDIVLKAIPSRYRYRETRIHPATRTFQAVRIAVNRELESLETGINKAVDFLSKGSRICIISFHSLEDRVVKLAFKKFAAEDRVEIITPKPIPTSDGEKAENPASRSAKLRVAQKL